MTISGVGSKFYQNNVVTTKSTKSANSAEKKTVLQVRLQRKFLFLQKI